MQQNLAGVTTLAKKCLKKIKNQPADASETPSMDGAMLAPDQFCHLNSWHLGALYNEAGNGHTLSL